MVLFQIQQCAWESTFWPCLFIDILCNLWESFFSGWPSTASIITNLLSLHQNSGILIRSEGWFLAKCRKQPLPRQRCIPKTLLSILTATSSLRCTAEALFWAFIETNRIFPRLPFGIVAYASTLSLDNLCRNSCIPGSMACDHSDKDM